MFHQIIFPSKILPVLKKDKYSFDYWIVGSNWDKKLWIKCPCCMLVYQYCDVPDEQQINIKEFQSTYWRGAIRNCPNKHSVQTISIMENYV